MTRNAPRIACPDLIRPHCWPCQRHEVSAWPGPRHLPTDGHQPGLPRAPGWAAERQRGGLGPIPARFLGLPSGPPPGQTRVSPAWVSGCVLLLGSALWPLPPSSLAPSVTGRCLPCVTGHMLLDSPHDTDYERLNSCLDQGIGPWSPARAGVLWRDTGAHRAARGWEVRPTPPGQQAGLPHSIPPHFSSCPPQDRNHTGLHSVQ